MSSEKPWATGFAYFRCQCYLNSHMKRFAVIFLSLSLFHAGIAWALQDCSLHWDQSEHRHINEKPDHSDLPTGSTVTIHCVKSSYEIGPVVQSSRVRIHRPFANGVSLKDYLAFDSRDFHPAMKIHPRKFPFARSYPVLLATNQLLHLVLTVFRI